MTSNNSNNNINNINKSFVSDDYVINILNENDNKIIPDDISDISDIDIRKNTKLNTHLNSHLDLTEEQFRKLQKFYNKSDENNYNKQNLVKFIIILLLIIVSSPIVIYDLYYGYTDNSCIIDYPNGLNINMKMYLLVNGYCGIIIILSFVCFITCIPIKHIEDNILLIVVPKLLEIIFTIFTSFWNIIGSVIFWGKLYKEGNCDKNISTYLFTTLIIKLFCNYCSIHKIMNNKEYK